MLNLYQLSAGREDREGVTAGYVGFVKTILKTFRSIDRLCLPVSTAVRAGHGGRNGMKRVGLMEGTRKVGWSRALISHTFVRA